VYEFIKTLKPYFFSLREIKGNVSLDLRLPISWKYETICQQYKTIQVKVQDKSEKDILVSFISTATEDGYGTVYRCTNEVVDKNIEDEKKRELFDKKVREMRDMFEKMALDELENLNFKPNAEKYDTDGLRLVGESDEEGSEGSGESQGTNDPSTEDDKKRGHVLPEVDKKRIYTTK